MKQYRCPYPDCHGVNVVNAEFCASCGRHLSLAFVPMRRAVIEYPRSAGTAYLLWALCVVGVAGIHRFYLGRGGTGLLWLLTWGLLGIGLLYDLFAISRLVDEKNRSIAAPRW